MKIVMIARLLVQQLDVIERQHRAGVLPGYGELWDLFETKNLLKRQVDDALAAAEAPVPTIACSTPGCPQGGTINTGRGAMHCTSHAKEVLALRQRLTDLTSSPATPAGAPAHHV